MRMESYAAEFAALLVAEELADPQVFADVEVFDELPLYSRLHQLSFLEGLAVAERNRELILAAVRHLDAVDAHFRLTADGVLRMVSVLDWWVDSETWGGFCTDGTTELLTPGFWLGNLRHERMSAFRVYRPQSAQAAFVAGVVGAQYDVFDDQLSLEGGWCPERIYVVPAGRMPAEIVHDQPPVPTGPPGCSAPDSSASHR